MKKIIRRLLNSFGVDFSRYDPNRIGKDVLRDMSKFLQTDSPVVFDVGANVGQSVRKFRRVFPQCVVHSFEPSPSTFQVLKNGLMGFENLHLWNCALGANPGKLPFFENTFSDMSSFLPLGASGWGTIAKETRVDVQTVDEFCKTENVARIDVLKLDTQGFDLEVLRGAANMLAQSKIGLVYLEIIFPGMYEELPSFSDIYQFLISKGFRLVSFYDFHYQNQLVSWTDALFLHEKLTPKKLLRDSSPSK
jgi:FkbM family methyltransferase